jgi:hypothetical protein
LGNNDEENLEKMFNFIEIISLLENNNKILKEKYDILNHKFKYEVNKINLFFIFFIIF